MQIHLTKVDEITAKKDGKVWVKLNGLSSDTGEVIEVMIPSEKVDVASLKESCLSAEELVDMFKDFEPIQVFFDKRGRVDSVTE